MDYYIGLYRQLRRFCETAAEVTNYVIDKYKESGNLWPQKLNFDVSPYQHGSSTLQFIKKG